MADLTITAASVAPGTDAILQVKIAGSSLTAGNVAYLDPADDKVKLCDVDSATAAARVPWGIVMTSCANNQAVAVQTGGSITIGATVAAGIFYHASDVAGGIRPSADVNSGDYPAIIGYGISTTQIRLNFAAAGVVVA